MQPPPKKKRTTTTENGDNMATAFASRAVLPTFFAMNRLFILRRTLWYTICTIYYNLDIKRNDFRFIPIVTSRTTQYKFYETTTTHNRGTCAQSGRRRHMHHAMKHAPCGTSSTRWGTRRDPPRVQRRQSGRERDRHCEIVPQSRPSRGKSRPFCLIQPG